MKYLFQPVKLLALFCLTGGLFVACNGSGSSDDATVNKDSMNATEEPMTNVDTRKQAVADIAATSDATELTGKAEFSTMDNGNVQLKLTLHIPSKANDSVAVHIHANGDCGEDGKAAGGHWNPTNQQHGKWGSASFHSGDIGNIGLDAKGDATFEMDTDLWQIGGDSTKNILDKSMIVHGGKDDFVSQPSGNAGNRIGCGVIQ